MKMTKRIFAVLLALVLMLSAAATVSAAINNANLTITGAFKDDETVTAIRIFRDNSANVGSSPSYMIEDAWKAFFASRISGATVNDSDLSTKAYRYMIAMDSNSADMNILAEDARVYYLAHKNDHANDASAPEFAVYTGTTDSGAATVSNLPAGSYLVLPPTGSTSTARHTDAMIRNLRGSNVTIQMKSEYPSVEKKVKPADSAEDPADNTHAAIGDYVQYTLTSKVPEMSEYTNYYFAFKDTLSSGLTLVKDNSHLMTLTIGSETLEEDTDYTFAQNGQSFVVAISDLKALDIANDDFAAGDTITLTYYALVNTNAAVHPNTGNNTNNNTATVEYSNDPSSDGRGESNPDVTNVYTYEIEINKFSNETGTHTPLAGAVFEIYDTPVGTENRAPIKLINTTANGADTNTYRVATEAEIATVPDPCVTEVITPASGLVHIDGLDVGTYYLHETIAPQGYNILTEEVKVVISNDDPSTSAVTETDPSYVYYTIGEGEEAETNAVNDNTVNVENHPGNILPTTGGIGTTLLTVIGAALVIFGVIFTSRKKKKAE